jgi:hypothetical protein
LFNGTVKATKSTSLQSALLQLPIFFQLSAKKELRMVYYSFEQKYKDSLVQNRKKVAKRKV